MSLGPMELGLILLIVIFVFGAGRLSEVGSALGKTVREFRASTRDEGAGSSSREKEQ